MGLECKDIPKRLAPPCCVIAFTLMCFLAGSMLLGIQADDNWLGSRIDKAIVQRNAVADSLIESWNTEPFKDIIIANEDSCPESHPHDLFSDVWPGTIHACDCWYLARIATPFIVANVVMATEDRMKTIRWSNAMWFAQSIPSLKTRSIVWEFAAQKWRAWLCSRSKGL